MTKRIKIGNTAIGGGERVAVQSMLSVHNSDLEGNVSQAKALEEAGCDIVRVAVPNMDAVRLIPAIKSAVSMPLVADIHFDWKLAIESVAAGADKIRINPGNIGSEDKVKAVVAACKARSIPIRVGVNSGSVEKPLLEKYGGPVPEALVESARRHVELIERNDYDNIVISLKASKLATMMKAYRLAAECFNYPLHLGVTEAGTYEGGLIKSAIGIGGLLLEGIGDTIRVSLTDDPAREIEAARAILRAIGAAGSGVQLVSCPTCGRTEIDLIPIAKKIEAATRGIKKDIKVAIMGCVVNGPGEAAEADIGIAGGKNCAVLFKKGKVVRKLEEDICAQLLEEIEKL
ncbi:MAG: flavodoxin-dependent (E)-4-hydroxy-3-methylbut-2-enyl-diphosphate synthase [Oscillospiraceae bacterium]|nr:flavodoxin-dependent (E)-4-hydroxy-3-methylbut-2-enyl-diphosphate synthase [Oscillospiraceae bacterium]